MERLPSRWDLSRLEERLTFRRPHGRAQTYGGRLAENVTQAVCRDLLARAMLRLDAAGHEIVLHVHDEVVVELPDPGARAEVEAIVSEVPPWARGFPLAVSGALGRRYAK